jgi:hypothetical protein
MKSAKLMCISAIALLTLLAIPAPLAAKQGGGAAIASTQVAQVIYTNTPGTVGLKNVRKGDWLKIIVRWTNGGEITGVFTDNMHNAWYPSPMNFHSGTPNQEEFEAVAKQGGDLTVNIYVFVHSDVYYDVRLEEIDTHFSMPAPPAR